MKREIGFLFICLVLASCGGQKKAVSYEENKCKVVIVPPSEDFESFYKNIDSTYLFKNELAVLMLLKMGFFIINGMKVLRADVFLL